MGFQVPDLRFPGKSQIACRSNYFHLRGKNSKTQIETAVKTYLRELCESWEAKEETDMIVRLSQIEARILNVEGVADVEATTINGKAGNLALSFEKIPVLEAVNIV
mgnify:FL=1